MLCVFLKQLKMKKTAALTHGVMNNNFKENYSSLNLRKWFCWTEQGDNSKDL